MSRARLSEKSETVLKGFRIPEDLWNEFGEACELAGRDRSEILRRAVERFTRGVKLQQLRKRKASR